MNLSKQANEGLENRIKKFYFKKKIILKKNEIKNIYEDRLNMKLILLIQWIMQVIF